MMWVIGPVNLVHAWLVGKIIGLTVYWITCELQMYASFESEHAEEGDMQREGDNKMRKAQKQHDVARSFCI